MHQSPTEEELKEIHSLLRTGKKIEAIKIYRQVTRCGLREAKNAVEAMVVPPQEGDADGPQVPGADPNVKKGCAALCLVLAPIFLIGPSAGASWLFG